jgi:FkbM family methyltransferase
MAKYKSLLRVKLQILINATINKFQLTYFKFNFETTPIVMKSKIDNIQIKFIVNSNRSYQRALKELTWEPELISLIKKININETFLDIGACVGSYSIYAAKLGINVIAIEPNLSNSFNLSNNIILNKLEDKILTLKIAVAESHKLSSLNFSKNLAGGNSGSFLRDEKNSKTRIPTIDGFEQVLCLTIDELLETCNFIPKLIKIDTDTPTLSILSGGVKTLNNNYLKHLYIETQSNIEAKNITNFLTKFGFILEKELGFGAKNTFSNMIFIR